MPFLLDTSVWIDIEQGALAPGDVTEMTCGQDVYFSPVTVAELRFGAESAADSGLRVRRLAALARLERKPMLPLDASTGMIFGTIAAGLKAAGRSPRRRVQDIWLASQAIQHACSFLTRNPADFADMPGLVLVSYRLAV